MICKNCNSEFEGNFCNNCGQSKKISRISFRHFLSDFSSTALAINRGFPFTFREMCYRPGAAVRNYLEGKRIKYTKPVTYLFLASAIYVILSLIIGRRTIFGDALSGIIGGLQDDGNALSSSFRILSWFGKNFAYSTLLVSPILAFSSRMVFFKSGYNYFEHLVFNIYAIAQQIFIFVLFTIIYAAEEPENIWLQFLPMLLSLLYSLFAYAQFFNSGNIILRTLKILLTYSLCFFLIVFTVIIIIGIDVLLS